MSSGTLSRSDLLRRLASAADEMTDVSMLGYQPLPEQTGPKGPGQSGKETGSDTSREPSKTVTFLGEELATAHFWRATRLTLEEPAESAWWQPSTKIEPRPVRVPGVSPSYRFLCDWQALIPRLRRALGEQGRERAVDLDKAIDTLSRGEPLTEVPRRRHSGWGPSICVIEDRRYHLSPYALDQAMVAERLRSLYPSYGIVNALCSEVDPVPVVAADGALIPLEVPAGARILLLTDLGCLQQGRPESTATWRDLVEDWLTIGCRITALVPCSVHEIADDLANDVHLIGWERTARRLAPDTRTAAVEQLLVRLAPVVRYGPGLLRELRLSLSNATLPASIESLVWQHGAVTGSVIGQSLGLDNLHSYRARFLALDEQQQRQTKRLIEAWSQDLPYELYLETVWQLADARPALFSEKEIADAGQLLRHVVSRARQGHRKPLGDNAYAWLDRVLARKGESARQDSALWRSLAAMNQNWLAGTQVGTLAEQQSFDLVQRGNALQSAQADRGGSFLGSIRSTDNLLQTAKAAFWTSAPPPWAADWGVDAYGPWVEFTFQAITQRLRWIAAGHFRMGSPDSEAERFENEGPQHEVTLTQGYWLFDTTVTQDLWLAVMGYNESRFEGGERPVDSVSWLNAREFMTKLNDALPGLDLGLPTEAQWEYACRAGTSTPFSTGDNLTTDQANYNGDYPYAGYPKGKVRGQTLPVKEFEPNPRGLYQMHGNLWEWCADGMRKYRSEPIADPVGSLGGGSRRVLRGGAWGGNARYVRAAYRLASDPDYRSNFTGFRCARVQAGAEPQVESIESVDRAGKRRPAERGTRAPARPTDGGSASMNLRHAHSRIQLPDAPELILNTNAERLTLERIQRPEWASAIGRDKYGLWCAFRIVDVEQRLRWIPPGQFVMGSPEDEDGRTEEEGPQHTVTISRGFWLFDTPVTQALWDQVMDDNPSQFRSPDRPVDSVSWRDSQNFIERLNQRKPGLHLSLPREVEWEYACRAGTTGAVYVGDWEIRGESDAPVLDAIAWYGGNSGEGFDLDDGVESSEWPEKQYDHKTAGTRAVAQKQANSWGLFDMLGNVWEWCEDGWRDYRAEPVIDPLGRSDEESGKVLRGGAWFDLARAVRAACRGAIGPGRRRSSTGFRCARVQREPSQAAEPPERGAQASAAGSGRRPRQARRE